MSPIDDVLAAGPTVPAPLSPARGDESLDTLQRAADYRLLLQTLRPAGIGSIVFGLLAMLMASGQPGNELLGLIGLFLVGEGIWVVAAPSPAGLIVDGIALLVVGLWNIAVTFAPSSGGGGFFGILGFWQLVWGFQRFAQYRRFSRLPHSRPPDGSLRALDALAGELGSATPSTDSRLIEFQAAGATWKVRLDPESAVIAGASGRDLSFARKAALVIESRGKGRFGKSHNVAVTMGGRTWNGTIAPEMLERFEAWQRRSNEVDLDPSDLVAASSAMRL